MGEATQPAKTMWALLPVESAAVEVPILDVGLIDVRQGRALSVGDAARERRRFVFRAVIKT